MWSDFNNAVVSQLDFVYPPPAPPPPPPAPQPSISGADIDQQDQRITPVF